MKKEPEAPKFVFTKTAGETQKSVNIIEKLLPEDLSSQLLLQAKKVKSNEFHILHHGVSRIHALAMQCDSNLNVFKFNIVPIVECKLISKMLLPLFEKDDHIIIKSCEIVVELAKQPRNIRPMFEEGILTSIIGLVHSLDSDILLAGIRAINVFSNEGFIEYEFKLNRTGIYLMRFVEKANTIPAIASLIYSDITEIRDISRSLYFRLKASREFLSKEFFRAYLFPSGRILLSC